VFDHFASLFIDYLGEKIIFIALAIEKYVGKFSLMHRIT
jgi:hypothetical protein